MTGLPFSGWSPFFFLEVPCLCYVCFSDERSFDIYIFNPGSYTGGIQHDLYGTGKKGKGLKKWVSLKMRNPFLIRKNLTKNFFYTVFLIKNNNLLFNHYN